MALTGVGRLGIMRLGSPKTKSLARLGFYEPWVKVLIGGVDRTNDTRLAGVTVTDELNHEPNTATLRVDGTTAPVQGQEIKLYAGGVAAGTQLFGGHVLSVKATYEAGKPANRVWDCQAIDYTWLLNSRPVLKQYLNQSATAIVNDLLVNFSWGINGAGVAVGLPTVDEITFTNEDLADAITRVMERVGGYWYVDYGKILHAFLTDDVAAGSITQAVPRTMKNIVQTVDLSQVATRVTVRGGGSNAAIERDVGATTLPVEDDAWYALAGGIVECGPQRLAYGGVSAPGTGSIIAGRPDLVPTAPTAAVTPTAGGKLFGTYFYRVTFIIAGGESLPSPVSAFVVANSANAAPTGASGVAGVLRGVYQYSYTHVGPGGESPPSAVSAPITAGVAIAPDSAGMAFTATSTGGYTVGTIVRYRIAAIVAGVEQPAGRESGPFTMLSGKAVSITNIPLGPGGTTSRRVYYSVNGGPYLRNASLTIANNTTTSILDLTDEFQGTTAPLDAYSKIDVAGITVGPTGTTARRLYRTEVGGSVYKLVTQINDNTTTTYTDNLPDASLGVQAPQGGVQVLVSAIATGPAGTTARRLYRTELAGVGVYSRVTTLNDNTTVTFVDNVPDANLGDEAPTISTIPPLAGDATIYVSDLAAFPASGWVRVGSQLVRYTGRSGSSGPGTLTGIPAAGGVGALVAALPVDEPVLAAPHLTGVTGIVTPIKQGDQINIVVTVNDTTAQTALKTWLGSADPLAGIREMFLTDGRWSLVEATARGLTELTQRRDPHVLITFESRDPTIASGRALTIALTSPAITGTFKVQRVTTPDLGMGGAVVFPWRQVELAAHRYSFDDLLRQLSGKAA